MTKNYKDALTGYSIVDPIPVNYLPIEKGRKWWGNGEERSVAIPAGSLGTG